VINNIIRFIAFLSTRYLPMTFIYLIGFVFTFHSSNIFPYPPGGLILDHDVRDLFSDRIATIFAIVLLPLIAILVGVVLGMDIKIQNNKNEELYEGNRSYIANACFWIYFGFLSLYFLFWSPVIIREAELIQFLAINFNSLCLLIFSLRTSEFFITNSIDDYNNKSYIHDYRISFACLFLSGVALFLMIKSKLSN